jgi:hypothetical protein
MVRLIVVYRCPRGGPTISLRAIASSGLSPIVRDDGDGGGIAMHSLCRQKFARSLIGALAVIASAGCDQPVDALGKDHGDNRPMTREDAYRKQLDLDVAAIIGGMTRAHGAQVVALMPEH